MYLKGDVILLFSLFQKTNEGKPSCDFPNQKVWILIWEVMNIFAVVCLIVALGRLVICPNSVIHKCSNSACLLDATLALGVKGLIVAYRT